MHPHEKVWFFHLLRLLLVALTTLLLEMVFRGADGAVFFVAGVELGF